MQKEMRNASLDRSLQILEWVVCKWWRCNSGVSWTDSLRAWCGPKTVCQATASLHGSKF